MSKKQIIVLWTGFALYVVCVLFEPVSRWLEYVKADLSWSAGGNTIVSEFWESLNGSFAYGAVILVLTLLTSVTIGWFESRKEANKDDANSDKQDPAS
jgi:ABC-type sulfate transport system permease component